MTTAMYLLFLFILIRVIQYVIKMNKEQKARGEQPAPQVQEPEYYDIDDSREPGTIKSALGLYTFHIDKHNRKFSFNVNDELYLFEYKDLTEYALKTTDNAIINIELKTSRIDLPYLNIECFSKIKAVNLLPDNMRRPQPLHQLYESELKKAEDIKLLFAEIMKVNRKGRKEVPFPLIVENRKNRNEYSVGETRTAESEIPNLMDIIESVRLEKDIPDSTAFVMEQEPVVIEESEIEVGPIIQTESLVEVVDEPILYIPTENAKPMADNSVRVSLSDVEQYAYGKFLESDIREAVGNAKMKGQSEIVISKEQLERLKQ